MARKKINRMRTKEDGELVLIKNKLGIPPHKQQLGDAHDKLIKHCMGHLDPSNLYCFDSTEEDRLRGFIDDNLPVTSNIF